MTPPAAPGTAVQTVLERRYRRLLRLLPRPERAARGDEMLGVLLDSSRPGQRRPTAGDAADLVGAAVRSRLRLLLVVDPVARLGALGAAVLLLLAIALAVGELHWRGVLGAAAPSSGPVLVDRFPDWEPKPVTVGDDPVGPAMVAYADGAEDVEEFIVVLGVDGSAARRVRIPGDLAAGSPRYLLAPDGSRLAQVRAGVVAITDLVTGRAGTPFAPSTESTELLAWSADGERLALRVGQRTEVRSLTGGPTVTLSVGALSAAFAADGRLALAVGSFIEVHGANGTLLARGPRPEGWQIAPAGWSDGFLALSSRPDVNRSSRLPSGEPGLRTPARAGVPALLGAPGRAVPLAWQGDRLLADAGGSIVRWDVEALTTEMVTRLDSDWFKGELRLATGLTDAARSVPLATVDRGPASRTLLPAALGIAVVALVLGWGYPPTHVRLTTRTVQAALLTVGEKEPILILLVLLCVPVVPLAWLLTGLEPLVLIAVGLLVAGSAYAMGRSLGRARYVTAASLGTWLARQPTTG
ncbi:MAG TPA: hypothetical protein VF661_08040 [Actinomycetales bacterium]